MYDWSGNSKKWTAHDSYGETLGGHGAKSQWSGDWKSKDYDKQSANEFRAKAMSNDEWKSKDDDTQDSRPNVSKSEVSVVSMPQNPPPVALGVVEAGRKELPLRPIPRLDGSSGEPVVAEDYMDNSADHQPLRVVFKPHCDTSGDSGNPTKSEWNSDWGSKTAFLQSKRPDPCWNTGEWKTSASGSGATVSLGGDCGNFRPKWVYPYRPSSAGSVGYII